MAVSGMFLLKFLFESNLLIDEIKHLKKSLDSAVYTNPQNSNWLQAYPRFIIQKAAGLHLIALTLKFCSTRSTVWEARPGRMQNDLPIITKSMENAMQFVTMKSQLHFFQLLLFQVTCTFCKSKLNFILSFGVKLCSYISQEDICRKLLYSKASSYIPKT